MSETVHRYPSCECWRRPSEVFLTFCGANSQLMSATFSKALISHEQDSHVLMLPTGQMPQDRRPELLFYMDDSGSKDLDRRPKDDSDKTPDWFALGGVLLNR